MSSTGLDISLENHSPQAKWNRAGYNHRSQLSSLLLDIRWRLIQYFPLSKFTYYKRYLNAVTPFGIIAAISIYIIVVAMAWKWLCITIGDIKKGARKNVWCLFRFYFGYNIFLFLQIIVGSTVAINNTIYAVWYEMFLYIMGESTTVL